MWMIAGAFAGEWPSIDEPLRTRVASKGDAVVAVGLEDYAFIADVPFARRDAASFQAWALYTRGVSADHVQVLTTGAREEILDAVGRGAKQVGPDGVLWLYYAGHGAASPKTGERMLLGDDARPTNFEARGVTIEEIRRTAGVPVRMVLDTCYTGVGRGGEDLVPGGRFAVPVTAIQVSSGSEWTAAGPNEISRPFDAAQHGAFTYFSIGALRGWADGAVDGAKDGEVTAAEADRYVARALGAAGIRTQTPGWYGSTDVVLAREAREEGPVLAELGVVKAAPTASATMSVGEGTFGSFKSQIAARRQAEMQIRKAATADWASLYEVLKIDPHSPESLRGLELFISKYASAKVEVAGASAAVATPELDLANRLLERLGKSERYSWERLDIKDYRKPDSEKRSDAVRLKAGWLDISLSAGVGKPFAENVPRVPLSGAVDLALGFGYGDAWSIGVEYGGMPGTNTGTNLLANLGWHPYKRDMGLVADVIVGGAPRLSETLPPVFHAAVGVRYFAAERNFIPEIGGRISFLLPQDVDSGETYPTIALSVVTGIAIGQLAH